MKLIIDQKERFIKFFEGDKDINIIEIKEIDEFMKDIKFLNCNLNYLGNSKKYEEYLDQYAFTLQYPHGGHIEGALGTLINIDNYEFDHIISTVPGLSGSPIILLSNSKIIGIYKLFYIDKNLNIGSFIAEIFNEINNNNEKDLKNKNDKNDNRTKIINNKKIDNINNDNEKNNNVLQKKEKYQILNYLKIMLKKIKVLIKMK